MAERVDYLIVGNSAAGVSAAEMLRALDAQASILMLSNEPYAAYGRPLISYLIEGKTTEEAMAFREADFYERNGLQTKFGPAFEAVGLNPDAHEVRLLNGEVIGYGTCLLATGSVPFVPPIEGLDGRENVHRFMTLDDAKGAWADVAAATNAAHAEGRASRVLVIGGGLIGMKAAEALSHHADEVVVLELAARILPAVLDETGASLVARQLAAHGIRCMPGVSAQELRGEGARVTSALLTTGEELSCDAVIAAVGVRPASRLAVEAGAQQGRGLVVGPDLQTTLPDVYAAGDVTQVTDSLDGSKRPLALWPNAIRQGRMVALHMAGSPLAEPFEGNFAVNAVDFFDISLLTSGIINPPEDGGFEVHVWSEGDAYAKFIMKDDRLMGYVLLNRPENAGIYTALIEHAVPLSSVSVGASELFDRAPLNLDFSEQQRWARLHRCYPENRDQRGWERVRNEQEG